MDDIAVVISWFFIVFFCHIILHRIFFRWKMFLVLCCGIYFLGIPIILFKHMVFPQSGVHLIITSCVISFIYSVVIVLLYYPRLLKGQVPLTILYRAFSQKRTWKKKELEALFLESELVGTRLDTLIKHTMIYRNDKKLFLTSKGRMIYRCISVFLFCSGMEVDG